MSEAKTIVITGAGTGIGEACARRLANDGHNLVLIGRRRQPLERVAAQTGGLVLVGNAASYITGQTIVVDDGATLPETQAALD